MGQRINYEILGSDGTPAVVLYSNSSHEAVDGERIFRQVIEHHFPLVTEIVKLLLEIRYPSAGGNHREGDPVFWIDLEPGHRDFVLQARFDGATPRIDKQVNA